jgi:hypothetical protein
VNVGLRLSIPHLVELTTLQSLCKLPLQHLWHLGARAVVGKVLRRRPLRNFVATCLSLTYFSTLARCPP